jgi:hypothetical protein
VGIEDEKDSQSANQTEKMMFLTLFFTPTRPFPSPLWSGIFDKRRC